MNDTQLWSNDEVAALIMAMGLSIKDLERHITIGLIVAPTCVLLCFVFVAVLWGK